MENKLQKFYEIKEDEASLQEISKIRKAVLPIFDSMFSKMLEEVKPKEQHIHLPDKVIGEHSVTVDLVTEKFESIFKANFTALTEKIAELLQKNSEIRKVEVTNQAEPPVIKIIKKIVKFPSVQKVEGKVSVAKLEKLQTAVEKLTEVIIDSKPKDFPYKKQELIPVAIKDMPVADNAGGKFEPEKIWLREEFTYTTISGTRVPTTITRWDEDKKVIENYQYEVVSVSGETYVSPVVKSRNVVQHSGVGA